MEFPAAHLAEHQPATYARWRHAECRCAGAQLAVLIETPAVRQLPRGDGAGMIATGIDGAEREVARSGAAAATTSGAGGGEGHAANARHRGGRGVHPGG